MTKDVKMDAKTLHKKRLSVAKCCGLDQDDVLIALYSDFETKRLLRVTQPIKVAPNPTRYIIDTHPVSV